MNPAAARRLRPIGQLVALFGGTTPVEGVIVGYTFISLFRPEVKNLADDGWAQGYLVRLAEGCDTDLGMRLREIAVFDDELTTIPRR